MAGREHHAHAKDGECNPNMKRVSVLLLLRQLLLIVVLLLKCTYCVYSVELWCTKTLSVFPSSSCPQVRCSSSNDENDSSVEFSLKTPQDFAP